MTAIKKTTAKAAPKAASKTDAAATATKKPARSPNEPTDKPLSADERAQDPSFDGANDGKHVEGSTAVHAGNAMVPASDVEANFAKTFGMPMDSHDPHRAKKLPAGQVNAVSIKDNAGSLTAADVADPLSGFPRDIEPIVGAKASPTHYEVVITPQGTADVRFTSGNDFALVTPHVPTKVAASIYEAIKDSSIPFSANPL